MLTGQAPVYLEGLRYSSTADWASPSQQQVNKQRQNKTGQDRTRQAVRRRLVRVAQRKRKKRDYVSGRDMATTWDRVVPCGLGYNSSEHWAMLPSPSLTKSNKAVRTWPKQSAGSVIPRRPRR